MCGIAGLISTREPASLEDVEAMTEALRHRGPDDWGVFADGPVALGHTRLAVVDLSPGGHQPMFSADGRFSVVFNGEIYNFREVRRDLVGRGHVFRTNSDTEVLLAAYAEHGSGCVDSLRGMFAFAVWDSLEQTLFVARDRLGKKPLYYVADGPRFAFASEIQAIRRLDWVPDNMDADAINAYFALQYIPGPATAFKRIRKLLPGCSLSVCGRSGRLRLGRYWAMEAVGPEGCERADPAARVVELLEESVRMRLAADVDVGVLLSGGIDSSLITAMAVRQGSRPVKTFSVGFEDRALDETAYADEIARLYKTDHHTLTADEVTTDAWEKVVEHMDEPLGDPACVPTYLIAQVAARHVKVVLSGEGADELFSGYPHYRLEHLAGRSAHMPALIRRSVAELMRSAPARRLRFSDRLEKVLESRPEDGASRWTRVCGEQDRLRLFSSDFLAATRRADPLDPIHRVSAEYAAAAPQRRAIDTDLRTWLPDDLLMKVDRMTMAHSLEARTPFLDHHVVELVRRCDVRWIGASGTKSLLRQIAGSYLPPGIVKRPKHGFEVPVRGWLLHTFRELAEESFSRRQLAAASVFNPEAVRREWGSFVAGRYRGTVRRMWLLFCFAQWTRRKRRPLRRPLNARPPAVVRV